MQRSAKIFILILEGIIKKISYERLDSESVDEKSLCILGYVPKKLWKKNNSGSKGLNVERWNKNHMKEYNFKFYSDYNECSKWPPRCWIHSSTRFSKFAVTAHKIPWSINARASRIAIFRLSMWSRMRSRMWSRKKPMVVFEKPLHSPKVTIWCGMNCNRLYGPFF